MGSECEKIGHQTWRYLLCGPQSGSGLRTGRDQTCSGYPEQCGKQAQPDDHMRSHHFKNEQGETSNTYRDQREKLQDRKELSYPAGADPDDRQAEAERICMPYRPGHDAKSGRGDLYQS